MAEAKKKPQVEKQTKKPSVRELAKKSGASKKRTLRVPTSILSKRFKKSEKKSAGKRRKLIVLPNNRFGRVLDVILFALPRYFRNSWREIRLTTWPGRRETIRLTLAVFIFSAVFAVFVAALDFGLDKIFKHLIIK